MLKDVLTKELIQTKVEVNNWEEALEKSAVPLIKSNKITKDYVEGMKNAIKEMGPYIVIMPGIALAHSRPDESVLEDCISLTTLKNPVKFGAKGNDPVHTIVTFASTSNDSHLSFIQNLASMLSDEANVEKLKSGSTVEEVFEMVQNY